MSEHIGKLIKVKREEKGISQAKLAAEIKKSSQLLCDIEAGRRNPSIETLARIVDVLGISLDAFFLKKNSA